MVKYSSKLVRTWKLVAVIFPEPFVDAHKSAVVQNSDSGYPSNGENYNVIRGGIQQLAPRIEQTPARIL
jgi:hypothetical protein